MEPVATKIIVTRSLNGERLDLALVKLLPGVSRRKIRAAIDSGGCFVNKKRMRMSSAKVSAGQAIEIQLENMASALSTKLTDDHIIQVSEDFIVINKPAGIYSQPVKKFPLNHLLYSLKEVLKSIDLGVDPVKLELVHRLDLETTGIILIASNSQSAEFLTDKFKHREIDKTYHALCYGKLKKPKVSVENFLTKAHPATGIVSVTTEAKGLTAQTNFKEINYFSKYNISLVEAKPKTGRTHQIRVHLKSLGCPILGDKKYTISKPASLSKKIDLLLAQHHLLHAKKIAWKNTSNANLSYSAAYSDNFSQTLSFLTSTLKT